MDVGVKVELVTYWSEGGRFVGMIAGWWRKVHRYGCQLMEVDSLELAYQYATKGASLVLVARREQAVKEVAMAALGKGSPDVLVIKADISKQSECKRVIEEAIAHFTKLNHLVVNAGLLSSSLFEDITNISAFNQIMASKAALIRFYETLRAELGSDIRITILGPGFIASELTKGKFLQKGGEIALTEEIRDVGLFPVGYTDKFAEIVVESACRGDEYVTWPSWYQPFHAIMFFAPEIINWYSRSFYLTKPGVDSSKALSRKILEATGAKKFLYPSSIRSPTAKLDCTK
ncbi:hypothetical protein IEQ34_007933 [Dendrobium chrysotoxum]|uniref:Uncharacterized protein n=1 Tax=Dendrobium chrysotoxum TaxID=161865 RepID=A0AAV7H2L3_DENCH|nr:hypothetical protein IEQ34_007933 [Dendrobium chrysotoxum]